MLAVLYKNSPVIRLYDLQHTQVGKCIALCQIMYLLMMDDQCAL